MGDQTMVLCEQGENNWGVFGALSEEDQKRYDEQLKKEEAEKNNKDEGN